MTLTQRSIASLRDDIAAVVEEGIAQGKQPRTIANRCIHVMVLHQILPETDN